MTNKQKKKNRNSRDSYGRLLANGWHLEVSRAEININNDGIPIVLSADIHGCDYHGSCFSQTMIPPTQLETRDKRTETHASDCVSRQAAIDELLMRMRPIFATNQDIIESDAMIFVRNTLESLPSAQPDIIHCRDCKYHIDGFFCQVANHHTSDKDCCASVFGAERRRTNEAD